ncbi:MAG: nucleotidyltransferase family protein [Hyphomicrobiaceae bacterium]|nr:nucleotidyltransferase family protein [Hyphomicrobiaceae bacterium]
MKVDVLPRFIRTEGTPHEFDLLAKIVLCSGPDGQRGRIVLPRHTNFDKLLELGERHRVLGLLARKVTSGEVDGLPDPLRIRLEAIARDQSLSFLRQTAETIRIVRILEANGVSVIVLKGCPLALKLYEGCPEVRHSSDIDLLVAPEDHSEAERVLGRDGYVRITPGSRLPQSAASMAHLLLNAYEFFDFDRGTTVELHHRPLSDPYIFSVSFDKLLAQSERMNIGGETVCTLGSEHLAVYLCCHAAGDMCFRMKWIADLTRLFEARDQQAVGAVLDCARALGCKRSVQFVLVLLEELMGRRYRIFKNSEREAVGSLVRGAKAALLAPDRESRHFQFSYVLPDVIKLFDEVRLAETWSSRGFALLRHLANHKDLGTLRLGAEWCLLYAIVGRPLALLRWVHRTLRPQAPIMP